VSQVTRKIWAAIAACGALSIVGAAPSEAGAAKAGPVHLNEIQTINTHNSYRRETSRAEQDAYDALIGNPGNYERNLAYSHVSFEQQFELQNVRGIEIDLFPDPAGGLYAEPLVRKRLGLGPLPDPAWRTPGIKVLHIVDADYNTNCPLFVSCLRQVKAWSDAHPDHVPIFFMLELKQSSAALVAAGGVQAPPWDAENLNQIDTEIRSVFGPEDLVTPDDVRKPGLTLDQSVTRYGWPLLDESRGKVLFVFNNVGGSSPYTEGHPNLEGRVVFPNAVPGSPNGGYRGRDEVLELFGEIRDLVARNYLIRTRSDISLSTVRAGDTRLLEHSLDSGAQMISTDFPSPGMSARYGTDFVAQLPGGVPVRCNPVNAPPGCRDDHLEPAGK
jgi:hypothetical protein